MMIIKNQAQVKNIYGGSSNLNKSNKQATIAAANGGSVSTSSLEQLYNEMGVVKKNGTGNSAVK